MLASAVSVPASLLGGLGYLSQLAGHVKNRFRPDSEYVPADPYRPSMSYQYAADAIRGGAAEAIADSWAGRPGAFLYQTGMSMADSGVAAALTAGTGLPAAALLGGSPAGRQRGHVSHDRRQGARGDGRPGGRNGAVCRCGGNAV